MPPPNRNNKIEREEDLRLDLDDDDDQPNPGTGAWLTTYADMVTLLMTFFILLFSMSTLDVQEYTDSFTSIKAALEGRETKLTTSRVETRKDSTLVTEVLLQRQRIEAQKKVFQQMRTFINTKGIKGVVSSVFDKGKITLRLPAEVLFAPGSATLTPQGERYIGAMRDFFIKNSDQTINIKGFTDSSLPSANSRWQDNWELSAMRAVNVLRYLMSLGIDADRMTATGLADMDPLYPNNTPQNRARNRRVEFEMERTVGG